MRRVHVGVVKTKGGNVLNLGEVEDRWLEEWVWGSI